MPIPFRLLVVPVLIIFEFIEPMGFLQWIVILPEDGNVVWVGVGFHQVAELRLGV